MHHNLQKNHATLMAYMYYNLQLMKKKSNVTDHCQLTFVCQYIKANFYPCIKIQIYSFSYEILHSFEKFHQIKEE